MSQYTATGTVHAFMHLHAPFLINRVQLAHLLKEYHFPSGWQKRSEGPDSRGVYGLQGASGICWHDL